MDVDGTGLYVVNSPLAFIRYVRDPTSLLLLQRRDGRGGEGDIRSTRGEVRNPRVRRDRARRQKVGGQRPREAVSASLLPRRTPALRGAALPVALTTSDRVGVAGETRKIFRAKAALAPPTPDHLALSHARQDHEVHIERGKWRWWARGPRRCLRRPYTPFSDRAPKSSNANAFVREEHNGALRARAALTESDGLLSLHP
jgi:hypothetical protein